MLVNSGRNKNALQIAGGTQVGFKGINAGGAPTATTFTDSGAAFTTAGDGLKGKFVVSRQVYGVIISNTATVLTVDRWYDPANPTGAAGTTPATSADYSVLGGSAPVFYMALTENTGAAAAGDTALTGEITTAGGGLLKKACAYAHTADTNTYTLTATFTANGSDVLPKVIAKIGTFDNLTASSGLMFHETLLSATATLAASGDAVTITQTVTLT